MALCIKCLRTMRVEGTKMVCPNCTYQYEIPLKVLSQSELLKENKELKEYTKLLEAILDDLGYKGMHRRPTEKP